MKTSIAHPVEDRAPSRGPVAREARHTFPRPAGAAAAAGPLARPARVVAGWMAAVAVVVAGSTAYLSLLVHMAMVGQYAARLERELETERRRAEVLEVALARETSPARTEAMARVLLAMERPRQVRVVVLDAPGASPARETADKAGTPGPSVARAPLAAGGAAGKARGDPWPARLAAALAELASRPVALARQLPLWP